MQPTNDDIKKILEGVLTHLGVVVTSISSKEIAETPHFEIHTPDSRPLIGKDGEILISLTTLARKIAEKKAGGVRVPFVVDVNGYLSRRTEDLKNQAFLLGERVRTFRTSVPLSPMNAYERMVIHEYFSNIPDVTTESEGEGKNRHIVLKYVEPGKKVSDEALWGLGKI